MHPAKTESKTLSHSSLTQQTSRLAAVNEPVTVWGGVSLLPLRIVGGAGSILFRALHVYIDVR